MLASSPREGGHSHSSDAAFAIDMIRGTEVLLWGYFIFVIKSYDSRVMQRC